MKRIVVFIIGLLLLCGCDSNIDKGNLIVVSQYTSATHNLTRYHIVLKSPHNSILRRMIVTAPHHTYEVGDTLTIVSIRKIRNENDKNCTRLD